jgi:sulfonate transport system substrate-binding protein
MPVNPRPTGLLRTSRRQVLLSSALVLAGGLASTITALAPSGSVAAEASDKSVRVGYQKYGTLSILKSRGSLERAFAAKGVKVDWLLFPSGPALLEALNTGSIHLGSVGEAPPIFAQAANNPFVYVASSTPNPHGEGILVPRNSPLRSVKDLKGKKVALNKGSNVHYLLVKLLEKNGLQYSDVKVVFLPPADARAAYEAGSVDAWVIWDPFFTQARRATNSRVLADGEGVVANREFFIFSRDFAKGRSKDTKTILTELDKTDSWAKKNVRAVANQLSPELKIDAPTLVEVLNRRPSGIVPISPTIVSYQQNVADTFRELKLIPSKLNVKEKVYSDPVFKAK